MPLTIENDGNAAAWGEFRFGVGSEADHLVFVALGTGIGGGVITQGILMRGAQGSGGELGHVTIQATGPRCACGNHGCLEALASGTAIGRRARELAVEQPDSALGRLAARRQILGEDVTELAREGDEVALSVLDEAGRWLGVGLAGFVNIFNPEVVAVGGGVMEAGELVLEAARKEVILRARPPSRDLADVKVAYPRSQVRRPRRRGARQGRILRRVPARRLRDAPHSDPNPHRQPGGHHPPRPPLPARGRPHSLRGHQAYRTPARPLRDKGGPHPLPRAQREAAHPRACRTGEDGARSPRHRRRHPPRLRSRIQARARLHRGRRRDRSPPGPSALTTALVASGLPADTVVFAGFPPRKGRDRKDLLERVATEPSTFVLFESPHRLGKTLEGSSFRDPGRRVQGAYQALRGSLQGNGRAGRPTFFGDVKGEIVLVIRGGTARTEESIDDVVRRARDYVAEGRVLRGPPQGRPGNRDGDAVRSTNGWLRTE